MKQGAILLATFFLLGSLSALADTIVGGIITTDTVWSASGNPYIAEQSVLVMNGAKLTIEPGVEVRFGPAIALSVADGALLAAGTQESNIVFTAGRNPPHETTNRWGYVGFWDGATDAVFDEAGQHTNGCALRCVVVEYAGGTAVAGGVHVSDSTVLLDRCVIRHNTGGGIYLDTSLASVLCSNAVCCNTASEHGGGGIYIRDSDWSALTGNTICSNTASGAGGGVRIFSCVGLNLTGNTICSNTASRDGGGVDLSYSHAPLISNNAVLDNTAGDNGGGVCAYTLMDPMLTGNRICNNTASDNGGGLYLEFWGLEPDAPLLTSNVISSNTASGNGGGIHVYSSLRALLVGNIVQGNTSHAFGSGISINEADGLRLSGDSSNPTAVAGNCGPYQVYNLSGNAGSPVPTGPGNVDARNVWWGTTNGAEISDMIYDFFDDAGKGIVFYEPCVFPCSNAPPVISSLTVSNGNLSLRFTNATERNVCTLDRCYDLRSGDWHSVTNVVVTGEVTSVCWDEVGTDQGGFYRIRASEWGLQR